MGISVCMAHSLLREHAYKPIRGDVLLLGRQTMYFSPEKAIEMMMDTGTLVGDTSHIEIDSTTVQSKDDRYLRDDEFFRLIGVPKIRALDHSAYEGADIIHDLTTPIPDRLAGTADFLIDGSTLDNVFDTATALRNMARLLRPGGRLFSLNMASNHYTPYTIITAHWLMDYFTVNAFADCKVYIFVHKGNWTNFYAVNPHKIAKDKTIPLNFTSEHLMGVLLIAEKGARSTWDKTPVQQAYRSDEAWESFAENLEMIKNSPRPDPVRSDYGCFLNVNDDFFFIGADGKRIHTIAEEPAIAPAPAPRPFLSRVKSALHRRLTA